MFTTDEVQAIINKCESLLANGLPEKEAEAVIKLYQGATGLAIVLVNKQIDELKDRL